MKTASWISFLASTCALLFASGCDQRTPPDMVHLLAAADKAAYSGHNQFCPEAALKRFDSLLATASHAADSAGLQNAMATALLELGEERKAFARGEQALLLIPRYEFVGRHATMKNMALACLRMGERINCIKGHMGESCIFPIAGTGIHADQEGARRAIAIYEQVLAEEPSDLESRWLLNLAYMTIGGYPARVPQDLLIPGLDTDTGNGTVKPFVDVATGAGLNLNNMAGGSIVDDFNNDGYPDIITSSWDLKESMHYFRNNTDGTFTDIAALTGLDKLTGGLNLIQTDYNNDGWKDILVLRGAWKGRFGKEPNSLLRNNGDGSFTDVTRESGLLSFHPTQTATWADFNNDGWLDLFIGNETAEPGDPHPCELYISNRNGTFTEQAATAHCRVEAYVKGVTSGDYNRDGLPDIFLSTMNGNKVLLKNVSVPGAVRFEDVSAAAGLGGNKTRTFPTWFWDYDNDGWPDILVSGYEFDRSLTYYTALDALGRDPGNAGRLILYRNKRDGTFEDVSRQVGLNSQVFAMGANFGDIDNDGYPDMYFGTGNPLFQSLVPNKLFRNLQGRRFQDITTAARVGNLQKGHAVSFADLDNDGDEDIYIEMGGAFTGDAYQNSLYLNPGQNDNRWINVSLAGTHSNRAAIGAKIKVVFREGAGQRAVYRDVNPGGSFGSNPLTQHIGIGRAAMADSVIVTWPASRSVQVFTHIEPGSNIVITEGRSTLATRQLKKTDLLEAGYNPPGCAPLSTIKRSVLKP